MDRNNVSFEKDGKVYTVIDSGTFIVPSEGSVTFSFCDHPVRMAIREGEHNSYRIDDGEDSITINVEVTRGADFVSTAGMLDIAYDDGGAIEFSFSIKQIDSVSYLLIYAWYKTNLN
ncbi:MAG: hypothetical protein IJ789_02835 [Bacteroidales bacterium]|nr:hypothetical protein [Bacteroidales bacterium]